MKKRKGFTLVELVIAMAIIITMSGVTLSSNIYNEKEAINNVAVKCQTLIEAARNEAITQRDPRWVTLNYSQNQVTNGEIIDGENVVKGTYVFPAPVIFETGGTDLYIYFDAFGKLETYNEQGSLIEVPASPGYLSFFLTNKTGALIREARIYRNGGGVDLIWGGTTTAATLSVVIRGPSVGVLGADYSYLSLVEGGKPPYIYAWTSGSGNPLFGTAGAFTTKWEEVYGAKINLTVTDSSTPAKTASSNEIVFSIKSPLTASISGHTAWKLNADYSCTPVITGGAGPYSYTWTEVTDGKVQAGRYEKFTTQWAKVIVYPKPTITITGGPTKGKLNTNYIYTCTPVGGSGEFTYAWAGGSTPATGTASAFTTQWASIGTKAVTLTITDSAEQSVTSIPYDVTIYAAPTVTITGGPTKGKLNTDYTFSCTPAGGSGGYGYTWGGGETPSGSSAGAFTTRWLTASAKTVSLTITDSVGQSVSTSIGVIIYSVPTVTISGSSNGKLNTGYNYTCTLLGGMAPYTYAWASVGGTPATGMASSFTTQWAAVGTKTISLTITDSLVQTASETFSVTIYSAPTVIVTGPSVGKLNTGYTFTATPSGGQAPYTYSWGPNNAYVATWNINSWGVGAWTGHSMGGGVGVTVTDSLGQNYGYPSPGGSAGITIYDAPTVSISGATIGNINTGYAFTDTVVGGMGPYSYQWTYNSTNDNPHTSSWSSPDTYNQWTMVYDALGQASNNPYATITIRSPFTLTYTAGAGGTISGTTPQTVYLGANGTAVTANPSTGYNFVNWSDGIATATRTDTNVTANKTVTANFTIKQFTITASSGSYGSITATEQVAYGGSATFYMTPSGSYNYYMLVDGGTYVVGPYIEGAGGTGTLGYTFSNVTANHTISAHFETRVITGSYQVQTGSHQGYVNTYYPVTLTFGEGGYYYGFAWTVPTSGYVISGSPSFLLVMIGSNYVQLYDYVNYGFGRTNTGPKSGTAIMSIWTTILDYTTYYTYGWNYY
jgi:type II secretory pathway pseudopilin PulG